MSSKYGTFQTTKRECKLKRQHDKVILKPFGDIHRDSHNCDVKCWKEWLKQAKKTHTENTFYIGMGDYNDFASYSERKAISSLHESTIEHMDSIVMKNVNLLAKELSFMKGNILGLLHGNHEWQFQGDGKELSTQRLCDLLECPFLGIAAYVRLSVYTRTTVYCRLDIFANHGKGCGQLLGSTFNTLEKMANIYPRADIYLMGHDHKRGSVPGTKLYYDNFMHAREQIQHFGRTGSFLKSWVENTPSYAVEKMYSPASLGAIEYEITFKRRQKVGSDKINKYIKSIV